MAVTVQPGTYEGVTVAASIYEAPSGAVMCSMVVDVCGSHLKGGICLIQKDGTLSERGFKDVQTIFGWSEWDWSKWDQEPEAFSGAAVQAVVETLQGEKSDFSSIKYVNPPGGAQRLEKANVKSLAAKYGAKTRALFGGSTFDRSSTSARGNGATADIQGRPFDRAQGRPVAPRRPAPPATRPPPFDSAGSAALTTSQGRPPPPETQVFTSTMEECWDVFCTKHDGKPELELYGLWADRVLAETGKTQNDCNAEDWGRFMESMTADNLRY